MLDGRSWGPCDCGGPGGASGARGDAGATGGAGGGAPPPMSALTVRIVDTNGCSGNYGSSASVTANGAVCSITNTTAALSAHACTFNLPDDQITSVVATALGSTVFAGSALACGSDATETGSCQAGQSGICTCTFALTAARTVTVSICHP
jgi:hypothetical protein